MFQLMGAFIYCQSSSTGNPGKVSKYAIVTVRGVKYSAPIQLVVQPMPVRL